MYILVDVYERDITIYKYKNYDSAYEKMKSLYFEACETEDIELDDELQCDNFEYYASIGNMTASVSGTYWYDGVIEEV